MRPLAAQDETMFCALYTDAKTMRFIEPVYSQEKAQKAFNEVVKLNSYSDSGFNTWAIISKTDEVAETNKANDTKSGQFNIPAIGLVMFYNKAGNQQLKTTEIGIMLLSQARGKLLAEEAFGAMLSYGFNQLKLPSINVRFDKRNLAIQRITQKVGFSYNQLFANDVLINNAPVKNISTNNMLESHASKNTLIDKNSKSDNNTNSITNSNTNSDINNNDKSNIQLEKISLSQWKKHTLQYEIKVMNQ